MVTVLALASYEVVYVLKNVTKNIIVLLSQVR